MKRSNRQRRFLGRWVSQGVLVGPLAFLLVAGAGCPSLFQSESQRATHIRQAVVGRDGAKTVSAANTVVNAYASLNAGAARNATAITVADITTLATGFAAPLDKGDLILIIQMAGATIASAVDSAGYGAVTALGNAGHYEFAGVESVTGNQITLACGLKNDYTGATGKTQVIRVPQYTTLTIASGASITAPAWDGSTGGVVAVHAETTLQLDGKIDVSAKGFRGGAAHDGTAAAGTGVVTFRSASALQGGEKGESIAGYGVDYDAINGRYGRGAPANGGGGGDSHNAGGGGGANARHGTTWTGLGVMSSSVTGAVAWQLDPGYVNNTLSTSEGGGRGGYSYSAQALDPTTAAGAPGQAAWGGDDRRDVGGLGGHPLDNDPTTRLFMGGGGGAGDGNNQSAGPGGNGGGIVFVIAGAVAGAGSIVADGQAGGDSAGTATGGDAAGGGGGGGTVVVHAVSLAGISVSANGGPGGLQTGSSGPDEAEGPGAGGGGGYIAVSGGTVTRSAAGALGGTTNRAVMAPFPSNGATAGNDGQIDGDATSFLYCGATGDASTPDTIIVTHPTDPSPSPTGTFTFTSNEGGVTYQCNLDGAGWQACDATYTTPVLSDGSHTLGVRATDLSGNTDTTPATFTWDIVAGLLDAGVLDAGSEAGVAVDAGGGLDGAEDAGSEAGTPPVLDAGSVDQAVQEDAVVTPADVLASRADVAPDNPSVIADAKPVQVVDSAADGQGDALAVVLDAGRALDGEPVVLDGGVLDGGADLVGVRAEPAPEPSALPEPPSDAAAGVVNGDAAGTEPKLTLLGGGCSVSQTRASSPAALVLLGLALALALRRRRRG